MSNEILKKINEMEIPEFVHEDFILKKMSIDYAKDIFKIYTDPVIVKYLSSDIHTEISQTEEFINSIIERQKESQAITWAIAKEDHAIGLISLLRINYLDNRAMLATTLSREFWGKGILTNTTKLLLPFFFDTLKLNRIEALVDEENAAAVRVLDKVGLILEGTLRDFIFIKGEYRSMMSYSLLSNEH